MTNITKVGVRFCLTSCLLVAFHFIRMLSHSTEQEHGRKKRFSKNGNVEHQSMIEVVYKQTPSGEMKGICQFYTVDSY